MAQQIAGYASITFGGEGTPEASVLFFFFAEENSNRPIKMLAVFSLAQLVEVYKAEKFAKRLDNVFVENSRAISPAELLRGILAKKALPLVSEDEMMKFEGAMLRLILTLLSQTVLNQKDEPSDGGDSSPPAGKIGFVN